MSYIFSNVHIYRSIALDAFDVVASELESRRRPKSDGSPGWIITPDPDQKSFKQAMVCIAFAGMWYEAIVHLKMVELLGEDVAKEWDRHRYRKKLQKLGCSDQSTLDQVQEFADARNDLMHEKAHWNQDSATTAQKEAKRAVDFINTVESFIKTITDQQSDPADGLTAATDL